MDKCSFFVFSQYWLTIPDTQVFHVAPDISIRGWNKWDKDGTKPSNFNFSIVTNHHQKNILFMGALTASVYFFDEAVDSVQFRDMVTRDASGNLVAHSIVTSNDHRGNIANPAYRDYIVTLANIQIDGGVDGIFFDEVLSGYDGATYNGNEGFDDYTIKDFNTYLAAKYPTFTKADWMNKFFMTDDNYIDAAKPLDDLNGNFNYRKYLSDKGWQNDPLSSANPLSAEWGRVLDNRADTTSNTFLAKYTTKYWRDIVLRVRQYGRDAHGKEVLITSNGLFPYADFNALGMYNSNKDDSGGEAQYVPVESGHLKGTVSLQNVFKSLYQRSAALDSGAPVVLFIDWPTKMMSDYDGLPKKEKEDYWKIYGAEAYANGLFMAFHLRTAMPDDPTAASQGMLDFFKDYGGFYKENSSFYHHVKILYRSVTVSQSGINSSLMQQPDSGRYIIHLVNHNYVSGSGMIAKGSCTVSFGADSAPQLVYMKSPDFSGNRLLLSNFKNGVMTVSIDSLQYYDVIVLDYLHDALPVRALIPTVTEMKGLPSSFGFTLCSRTGSIRYAIPKAGQVTLRLYDISGRIQSELVNRRQAAGYYTVDMQSATVSSGAFLAVFKAGDFHGERLFSVMK